MKNRIQRHSSKPKKNTRPIRQPKKGVVEADDHMRLNKFIANAGVCSRREADELISKGKIKVNGEVVTALGTKVKPHDTVSYGGKKLTHEEKVYVLLNKPKDYITTADDPQQRKTVLDLLGNHFRERLYPVGRLDRNTTGLLLLTNDGELTKKLSHPRYGIRKIYHVHLDRPLAKTDLENIAKGVSIDGKMLRPDKIDYANPDDKREVGIELHSGQNRVVRRIFEQYAYGVVKLDRVVFAGLTKKNLPRGKWRRLSQKEISYLKMLS